MATIHDEQDAELFTRAGRRLTAAQADRRRFMKGLLASGAFATLAGMPAGRAAAQATPEAATPVAGTPAAAYDGALAAEQTMRLPTGEPVTMDPGVSYGDVELEILFNVFEGLVRVDQATGEVVPAAAESFVANADSTQFTFTLRQGLMWSDGTPLNANDFVYSWRRVLDPDTLSEYTSALYPLLNAEAIEAGEMELDQLGVTAVDDYTLQVDLAGATPYFPLLASTWTYSAVPQHVIDEAGAQWVEAENIVSSGPFMVSEWSHDQQITLVPNPNYYGDKPTLTQATYRIFEDASTQGYIAYEADEIDYAEPEGPDLDRIVADPALLAEIVQFPLSNTYFVVCDCTAAPTDNVAFRQALSKAIDRDTLANTVLRGQYLPAPSVLPGNIPGNNPAAALPESVDEAKQLLADAGIDPAATTLELTYVSSPARYKTVAEFLQATWQDTLGITVTLSPLEDSAYSDWRASRETQPFGVYTGTWGSDFADASNWFNQNFTSTSDHYRNHWVNAEFDSLCAAAAPNPNTEERDGQYSQAETIIVNEAPIIPMYRGQAFRAVKPFVKDLYFQSILSVVHLRTIKIAAS